ncbi:general stress protein [Streptomyces sp. NPDC001388]|uniref:general stress protein n=1 Tax=Streptomyces sp. NPDC001388 TaxID=3364568 RepID=UPI00367529AA
MTQHPPTAGADRPVIGSCPTHTGAQRTVDFLSDVRFPVERAAIIGSDVRLVETVLGRLTRSRAILARAGTDAWFGLLVGLLLSVFAARQPSRPDPGPGPDAERAGLRRRLRRGLRVRRSCS